MKLSASGWSLGVLLAVALAGCEDPGEAEAVSEVEEEAGMEPLHQEEYEPFEGEFTVDTARWVGER